MFRLPSLHIREFGMVTAIFVFSAYCAYLGVDFGFQWDEWVALDPAKALVKDGTFLPKNNVYPPFDYLLVLFCLIFDVLNYYVGGHTVSITLEQFLLNALSSNPFLVRARTLFALISLLTIFWVYLFIKKSRDRPGEALIGAAIVGFCWELSYHSRWLVPNTLLTQWAALSMIFIALGYRSSPSRRHYFWLGCASACAGLATATKYQAGLLLTPVALMFLKNLLGAKNSREILCIIGTGFLVLTVFVVAFIIIMPGSVFDYARFASDLEGVRSTYSTGHYGYTASPGFQHSSLIMTYLILQFLSPFPLISLFLFLLCLIGIFSMQRDRWGAAIFLSFPIIYILFLGISQKVMCVRNLMILVPYFAVLSARGVTVSLIMLKNRQLLKACFIVATCAALAVNAWWLYASAISVRDREKDKTSYPIETALFIAQHPNSTFAVSNKVQQMIGTIASPLKNVRNIEASESADMVVFLQDEIANEAWIANHYPYTVKTFGPFDVNFDYYPSWCNGGQERIVILKRRDFKNLVFRPASS